MERKEQTLGEPLGHAHDGHGVHGLVGRNQHEPLHLPFLRGASHDLGSEHVVLDRLERMLLHQRHVLVRRRVVHDFRRVRVQDFFHLPPVEDVADDWDDSQVLVPTAQLQLGEVEAALGPVEQDERLGLERGELARQL